MVEPAPVVAAARALADDLARRGVPGIVAVAVRASVPDIVVYVTSLGPRMRAALPTTWHGFPVSLLKSGPVRPA